MEASLLAAGKTTLCWHAKEVKPVEVVLGSARRLAGLWRPIALVASIDDVDGGAEICPDSVLDVAVVGHKEACHDVVHAWLRVLGRHVEPDAGSHGQEAVLVHKVWILQQVHLVVVGAGSEHCGEATIVIVP